LVAPWRIDAFVSARAEIHRLTLVTRNVFDFPLLKAVVNPWAWNCSLRSFHLSRSVRRMGHLLGGNVGEIKTEGRSESVKSGKM
jgi:hypothetical protein